MNQPPFGAPPGSPPPYGQPPGAAQQTAPAPAKKVAWWGGYVSLAVLALSLLLVIGTIVAAISSEELGMNMTMLTSGPLFFGIVGTIVALVTKKNPKPGVAIGAPLGCGCLAAIVSAALVAVFFVAIFPRL